MSNILHINMPAVASVYKSVQRRKHEVIVLDTDANPLQYPEDLNIRDVPGLAGRIAYRAALLHYIRWADIVHAHGGFWHRDLASYMRASGRRFVLHYHGDDVRRYGPGEASRRCEDLADAILLVTPDLKARCPDGIYVPNPIPMPSSPSPVKADGGPLLVLHAIGTSKSATAKGSDLILRAITKDPALRSKFVENLSHDRAVAQYPGADICVNEMRIGWYGLFALETMALGISTLSLFGDHDEEFGAYPVPEPTEKSLIETLDDFKDPDLRRVVGAEQRAFVSRVHDPETIVARVEREFYDV